MRKPTESELDGLQRKVAARLDHAEALRIPELAHSIFERVVAVSDQSTEILVSARREGETDVVREIVFEGGYVLAFRRREIERRKNWHDWHRFEAIRYEMELREGDVTVLAFTYRESHNHNDGVPHSAFYPGEVTAYVPGAWLEKLTALRRLIAAPKPSVTECPDRIADLKRRFGL